MHTVAQVIDRNFERSWYECVAIVQAVLSELAPGSPVPAPEDLLLNADGTLSLGFASESPDRPVVGAATLLGALLDGVDAPGGLRDLVTGNQKEPPTHDSVEGLSRALAFYERPNRSAEILAVYHRLSRTQTAGPTSTEAEFERLRERVASQGRVPHEEPEPDRQKKPAARLTQRQMRIAGVAAALALVLLGSTLRRGASGGSATGAVIDKMETTVAYAIAALLNSITGSRTAAAPATDAPARAATDADGPRASNRGATAASVRPASARAAAGPYRSATPAGQASGPQQTARRTPGGRPAAGSAGAPAGTPPLFVSAVPPVIVSPSGRPAFFESLSTSASDPVAASTRSDTPAVYTSTDPGVQPPALVRPQFPREPEPGDDTGYFDLVVDEQGNVERVKLLSPRRLFQERMLVAAAKAWKFRPAILEGQYVKYRLRVPIILTGMP